MRSMLATFNNNLPAAGATARSASLRDADRSGAWLESIHAFFGEDQPYCEPARAITPAPAEPWTSPAPRPPFRLRVKQVTRRALCRALRGTAVRVCRRRLPRARWCG